VHAMYDIKILTNMSAKILLPRTSLKLFNSFRVSAFQHCITTRFNNRSKINTDGCKNHNAPRKIIHQSRSTSCFLCANIFPTPTATVAQSGVS